MRIAMFMPELVPGALGSLIYRDLAAAFRSHGHSFDCLVTEELPGGAHGDGWMRRLALSENWQRLGSAARPLLRTRSLFAYAAASFFWAQREAHRALPADQD